MRQISGLNKIVKTVLDQNPPRETHHGLLFQPEDPQPMKSWFGRCNAFCSILGQVKLNFGQFDWAPGTSMVLNHLACHLTGVGWEGAHMQDFVLAARGSRCACFCSLFSPDPLSVCPRLWFPYTHPSLNFSLYVLMKGFVVWQEK